MPDLVETRFCRFAAPAGWSVLPGTGALGPDPSRPTRSVLAIESWLDEPTRAAEFVDLQMPLVQEELGQVELLRLDAAHDSRFDDMAVALFRTQDAQGPALLHYQLVGIAGFLAVCLTVTGEEQDHERWHAEAFRTLSSIEVPQGHRLRALTRRHGLFETCPTVQDVSRTPIPHLQLAVPRLVGWQLDETTGTFQQGPAYLELRPAGHGAGSVDLLFAQALADTARDTTQHLAWWERGDLPGGQSFYALATERSSPRTWGAPERAMTLRLFVQDQMPIELLAVAPELDADLVRTISALLSGSAWLPPEQCRLRLQEPWLPAELEGPWTSCGPGAYLRVSEPPAVINLSTATRTDSFRQHTEAQTTLLRSSPDVLETVREEECHGRWRQWEASRFILDAVWRDGSRGVLRACWLEAGREVYGLVVQGTDPREADTILLRLIESFRPGPTPTSTGGRS